MSNAFNIFLNFHPPTANPNVHTNAKDTLAYHDGRPDLFELVTIETVENQEDTAKEYQEHATAADEQDQLPDDQIDVELGKPSNKNA